MADILLEPKTSCILSADRDTRLTRQTEPLDSDAASTSPTSSLSRRSPRHTSFTMGQVLGKVAVVDEKPKEKPQEPKGPSFPDYMLDSNAVVSQSFWRSWPMRWSPKPQLTPPVPQTNDKATWRYGGPPDYTVTRQMWANGMLFPSSPNENRPRQALSCADFNLTEKRANHGAKSLETLVENLVKNWEIEASHKMDVSEWRTVDPKTYTFSINGGPPQDAEHMLKVCVAL